jgi:hypothetical protein
LEKRKKMAIPSRYLHDLYYTERVSDEYNDWERRIPVKTEAEAVIVSSRITGTNNHTAMLDIDIPAALLPSSTYGHFHLYIDQPMTWRKYKRFLRGAMKAGIIEKGFYRASVRRKHSALRLPGVKKGVDTPLNLR